MFTVIPDIHRHSREGGKLDSHFKCNTWLVK